MPKPHYGCLDTAQFDTETDSLREARQFWAPLTPTLVPHADIDAVHRHVDLILYTLPGLVIIVDQVTVGPQIKPVLLPALQNGTWGVGGNGESRLWVKTTKAVPSAQQT